MKEVSTLANMRRMLKKAGVKQLVPLITRRRNKRGALWLSLLGLGIAGGATAYTMRRGKSNLNIKHFMQRIARKTKNMDLTNAFNPTS